MNSVTVNGVIEAVRAELSGGVITQGTTYEQARAVFYRSVDWRPAVIVRPSDAGEVARVVSLARELGAELAIGRRP